MLAVDESTGKSKKLTVNGGLPASEIERMRKGVMKDTPKMELEKFANSIQSSADERIAELKRSIEEMQAVRDQAATTLNWLSRNRSAEREAIYVKKRKLEEAATSATHKR
ncbi:hypothetical protein PF001_g5447 [Phytophthora fragariae]|nr:hypothetical protein PF001_g5447 [Phytophthora fragariae]